MDDRQIVNLNIDDILPNRFQPRIKFNEQSINELAESIKEHGVIQPIVVRRIGDKFEIIAGERRYKASTLAGKTSIPAIITTLNDKDSAEVALIENVQRQDLTPIEEAISYKKILDMGYIKQSELGEKLGKKQSTIANKLRLLNLDDEVQEALMENQISERHARSLLKLNKKMQVLMLNRIINERLTVRKTDEEIEKLLKEEPDDAGEELIIDIKGDEKMNNDVLKEFNIPTEPIQESPNNEVFNSGVAAENVAPISSVNPVNPNPGFMDIDRIENEAKDINVEVKPADMEQLLKPTNVEPVVPVEEVQPAPVEEPKVSQTRVGKFFNMFTNDGPKDPNFVQDIESKQVNMDFGEPKFDEPVASVFDTPDKTAIPTDPFSLNTPKEEKVEDVVSTNPFEPTITPIVDSVSPINNIETNPFTVNLNTNTENNSEPSIDTPISPIVPDSVPVAPIIEPEVSQLESTEPVINPVGPVEPEPLANIQSDYIEEDFNTIPKSDVQPAFEQSVSPFTLTDDQTFASTQNRPYMMDDSVKFDEEGEIEVAIPNNEPTVQVSMKEVINTIRNCSNQIEKFGYKIETEEIDLPDSYEVTFKIKKVD